MSGWTALVPLKLGDEGKSRLSMAIPADERLELMRAMAGHVLATLAQVGAIDRIVVLSARRPAWWQGEWSQDCLGSLNPALEAWRLAENPDRLLVIHGDLPLVRPEEIETLLGAAQESGLALATDRAGHGTNALALIGQSDFALQFGPESRLKHQAAGPCTVIELPGLARDIDHPADLAEWRKSGQSI